MDEYIKRETAVRAVMAAKWVDGSDGAMAMEIVASPAAADVVPVVHGRWEFLGPNRLIGDCMCGTCSVCKVRCKYIVNKNICPNCGAKMDGERKDGGADHEAS